MAEDLVELTLKVFIVIVFLSVVGLALDDTLSNVIAPCEGMIYGGLLKAILEIVGLPTTIISICIYLIKRTASDQ